MSATYPPYVNAYGNLSKLFAGIKSASVPPKFTHDFMTTALGLKSTSYRAMIPLLKRLATGKRCQESIRSEQTPQPRQPPKPSAPNGVDTCLAELKRRK